MSRLVLAYHHGFGYGGATDWLTHMVLSTVVHALIYSFIFRLLRHLSLGEEAVLVGIVLVGILMWGRRRDRRF